MYKRLWWLFLLIPSFLFSSVSENQVVIKEGKNRTWLGVRVEDLSEKMSNDLKISHGVKITEVYKDSPAAAAELKQDDIIIAVDGQAVTGTKNLIELVQQKKAGEVVEIEYLRDGTSGKTKAELAQAVMKKVMVRPFKSPHQLKFMVEDQTWLGVHMMELTGQLREYFGVAEGQGILVKEVLKDSPAEKGGLKAGDIIIKVAEKKVRDLHDIKRAINYFEPGDEIEIKVIRDKKEKTFEVKLEERRQKDEVYFYGNHADEFDVPVPDEINIEIPEIEIEVGDEAEFESQLEEVPQRLEFKLQGLNEKLKELQEKLQDLKVEVSIDEEYEIQI
jgi:serine protease Do